LELHVSLCLALFVFTVAISYVDAENIFTAPALRKSPLAFLDI